MQHGFGLVFVEQQVESRQCFAQLRGNRRQQIGCNRRQQRHPQTTRERVAMRPRDVDDFVGGLHDQPRAADDVCAGGREQGVTRLPFDQRHTEVVLELLQLRRECGLADETACRSLAEVAGVGHGHEGSAGP